jgi:hypothetical protein
MVAQSTDMIDPNQPVQYAPGEFFAMVPELVIDHCSCRAVHLYSVLALYVNWGDNKGAWPSKATLAARLKCTVPTIDTAMKELVGLGVVKVIPRFRKQDEQTGEVTLSLHQEEGFQQTSNTYLLTRGGQTGNTPPPKPACPLPPNQLAPSPQASLGRTRPIELDPEEQTLLSQTPSGTHHREDVEALCIRLRDRMIDNGCTPPTITQDWRDSARLLLDKDGKELVKALNLIDWCQSDSFWKSNIRSMSKFRKQYDALRLKALGDYERSQKSKPTIVARDGTVLPMGASTRKSVGWEQLGGQLNQMTQNELTGCEQREIRA